MTSCEKDSDTNRNQREGQFSRLFSSAAS